MYISANPEECLNRLSECIRSFRTQIDYLQTENAKIKSEKYKDEELAEMKRELDEAREALRRGFELRESECKAIEGWKREHEEKEHGAKTVEQRIRLQGVSGGRYSYEFVPTGIGTIGKVRCSCGAEFCFRDLI